MRYEQSLIGGYQLKSPTKQTALGGGGCVCVRSRGIPREAQTINCGAYAHVQGDHLLFFLPVQLACLFKLLRLLEIQVHVHAYRCVFLCQ